MKQKLLIEFSGGRSSGFMTRMLTTLYKDKYDIVVCFANTGQENEQTLEFVHKCDKEFGFKTVWLEAVFGERLQPTTFKIVNFETACRNADLFENMCAKYGLPNVNYKHCTRELKLHPIHAYVKSLGWKKGEYKTAIGIRADEPRRYKKEINNKQLEEIEEYLHHTFDISHSTIQLETATNDYICPLNKSEINI